MIYVFHIDLNYLLIEYIIMKYIYIYFFFLRKSNYQHNSNNNNIAYIEIDKLH